jgi:hypothetical protein
MVTVIDPCVDSGTKTPQEKTRDEKSSACSDGHGFGLLGILHAGQVGDRCRRASLVAAPGLSLMQASTLGKLESYPGMAVDG